MTRFGVLLVLSLLAFPAAAQHHLSNWVYGGSPDTTVVPCWNDSLSYLAFPPGSMHMMQPDSIFCQMERLGLDSLPYPHDSTFLAWYGITAGRDSMGTGLMHPDSGHGHHRMQFHEDLVCAVHWDSSEDATHHGWRLTGIRVWDGQGWTDPGGAVISGTSATFSSGTLSAAVALVGEPAVVSVPEAALPVEAGLGQNYPNPFNPATVIEYRIPEARRVRLAVYDALGQEVVVLVDGTAEPGRHSLTFDAGGLAGGVYFLVLRAGALVQVRRMVLLR